MKLEFDWNDLPLVTHDLVGTGGRIRGEPEDFQVTEVPAYVPSGDGEHTYLWIEKTGHTTKFVLDELVRQFNIKFNEIGVAGLKDRHAITRQWISVPHKYESQLESFKVDGVQILDVTRHANKLGIGHLRGNRFRLRVRDANPNALVIARTALDRLKISGVPNYFGPQRFGNTGQNAVRGLELVLNGRMRGPESIPLKRFLIGSLQSILFNYYVRLRFERGLYDSLLPGDVAKKHDTGGMFTVEDSVLESPRAQNLEVSATGPLYGKKVMPAQLVSKDLEDEVLAHFELTNGSFKDRRGSRRITRVKFLDDAVLEATMPEAIPPVGASWNQEAIPPVGALYGQEATMPEGALYGQEATMPEGALYGQEAAPDGFWIDFALPKGSFATVVLREVMKVGVDAVDDGDSNDDD